MNCHIQEYKSVNIRVSGGLEFTLKSGGLVLFGGIENVEYKLSYLEQIIADMGYKKKEIEYIDMKDFCSEYKEAVVMPKSKDRI